MHHVTKRPHAYSTFASIHLNKQQLNGCPFYILICVTYAYCVAFPLFEYNMDDTRAKCEDYKPALM